MDENDGFIIQEQGINLFASQFCSAHTPCWRIGIHQLEFILREYRMFFNQVKKPVSLLLMDVRCFTIHFLCILGNSNVQTLFTVFAV